MSGLARVEAVGLWVVVADRRAAANSAWFRDIACEIYYEDHPPYEGTGDRCSIREIESHAAQEIR